MLHTSIASFRGKTSTCLYYQYIYFQSWYRLLGKLIPDKQSKFEQSKFVLLRLGPDSWQTSVLGNLYLKCHSLVYKAEDRLVTDNPRNISCPPPPTPLPPFSKDSRPEVSLQGFLSVSRTNMSPKTPGTVKWYWRKGLVLQHSSRSRLFLPGNPWLFLELVCVCY